MGKKRTTILGSEEEQDLKAKKAVKLEQKKMREGKVVKDAAPAPAPEELNQPEAQVSPSTNSQPKETSTKREHHRSKAYAVSKGQVNVEHTYPLAEGLELLRKVSLSKFDPTVELHLVLKEAPKDKISVQLPHAAGKARKVAIASDDVIKQIDQGKVDFDVLVATPAQMGKLVKYAKVLGPRGLMPNPKSGTVSEDPESVAKKLAADTSVHLKLDKASPVIHTSVGKLSLKDEQLVANIQVILSSVPGLKKVVLKSTHSPAIKIHA